MKKEQSMQKTTTFKQHIDGEYHTVTMPQNRVSAVIGRVDRLILKNKFDQALEVITPFIGEAPAPEPVSNDLKTVAGIVNEYRNHGRHFVMDKLMGIGLSKASAYYQARKNNL